MTQLRTGFAQGVGMYRLAPDRHLLDAVWATVAYADMFDFPLDREEIRRDLIGIRAPASATVAAIDTLVLQAGLVREGAYVVLPARSGLTSLRRERQERAARLWPVARRLGHALSRFPFVRMVAVTGSLAAGNPDEHADIDYLIVTAPDRLWSVRAIAVVLVRIARHGGVHLCPNYLLTTRALALDHQDLFTAHELLQAAPLAGLTTYRRLLACNAWAACHLPNRYRQRQELPAPSPTVDELQRVGERLLAGRLGERFEQWEGRRKQQRLREQGTSSGAGRFTVDICEGHYGHSRRQRLAEFERRCRQFGIAPPDITADRALPSPMYPASPSRPPASDRRHVTAAATPVRSVHGAAR